ncbi:hypothetical protein O181_017383 [Austropuccinia psidii MF-1]|uniref:Uncharacterized protein n=1 Tax=Austropuccinia psidii MF-1 TaxID=1389203 RepID=A0A9Q3GRR4_9BASI|nr:hypothetical protein [Austropuccinia psidii MF-1]
MKANCKMLWISMELFQGVLYQAKISRNNVFIVLFSGRSDHPEPLAKDLPATTAILTVPQCVGMVASKGNAEASGEIAECPQLRGAMYPSGCNEESHCQSSRANMRRLN